MAKSNTFQKISGFKRISTCMACNQRFVATKTNIYFCEACSKKRAAESSSDEKEEKSY